RSVVITGASSGIGQALARYYAAPGTALALIARRAPSGGLPGTVVTYQLDVSDLAGLANAARDFIGRFGAPELVIANAGVNTGTHGDDLGDVEKLRRVLDVNVTGMAATLAAFAPAMREARRGTLVGVASVGGFRGLAGNGAYCASKSAVITWLESLRAELYGSGVAVVGLCPGHIDTPITRVNRFRMPFLMSPDEAAPRFARAISARRRRVVMPWQMALVAVLLRLLPGWLYDRLAARAPRKPRHLI